MYFYNIYCFIFFTYMYSWLLKPCLLQLCWKQNPRLFQVWMIIWCLFHSSQQHLICHIRGGLGQFPVLLTSSEHCKLSTRISRSWHPLALVVAINRPMDVLRHLLCLHHSEGKRSHIVAFLKHLGHHSLSNQLNTHVLVSDPSQSDRKTLTTLMLGWVMWGGCSLFPDLVLGPQGGSGGGLIHTPQTPMAPQLGLDSYYSQNQEMEILLIT